MAAPPNRSDDLVAPISYDSKTIWLHWITAVLVVALWCLGETIDWFPRGTGRIAARSVHICLGISLGLILCYRLYWRIFAGRRLPLATSGLIQALSTLVLVALYATLFGTVVLGVANAWIRGDTLFNLFTIPAFDPGNKALREQVEDLHGLFANGLLILAGFHAAAALVHHFLLRDNVLQRMLPTRR
ncbi:cytochrome b [Pseudolysobacter antarcticus]|uniref:Cytochrome b n=2 Tax=Pseudolysobacter antarcticus TaxID=2511995 RepID=A0A411HQ19_9GAMM|nr:cytochrome b [Pseudolysobacter antarcticus]